MNPTTYTYVNVEDILPGDVIAKHGYDWLVIENRYDAIGNATMSEAPMPRRVLVCESAEDSTSLPPVGYRNAVALGFTIGAPVVARRS